MPIRPMEAGDFQRICHVYKAAFTGPPLCETLTDEEVQRILASALKLAGFSCRVLIEDNQLVGAQWQAIVSMDSILLKRGPELVNWIKEQGWDKFLLVWEQELFVHPDYQRRGFGLQLRESLVDALREYDMNLVVFTRLREDNIGTIKSAERIGMVNTGVSVAARRKPLRHYFWALQMSRS